MATEVEDRTSGTRSTELGSDVPLMIVAAVAAAAVFVLVHRALIDDAYITMTYARNLAFHFHWGLIPDGTANSATSPLNVVLLGAVTAVVRNAQLAVGVLLVACSVLSARWLARLSRDLRLSPITPYGATFLLLLNPLLLSTIGLESYLAAALMIGLLRYGFAGHAVAFGIVGGLAFLTRPDLAVVALVTLVVLRPIRRRAFVALGVAVLVALPWHLWSWFALGSALPDTLILKAGSPWGRFSYANGPLLYWGATPVATALAFLPVLLGSIALLGVLLSRIRRPFRDAERVAAAAGLAAAGHGLAYTLLNTAPYHWYYAPLITGMTVCSSIVAGVLLSGVPAWPFRLSSVVAAALSVLAVVSVGFDVLGVGAPWVRSPISTNWATAAQYEHIGSDLRGLVGDQVVVSPGEIGTLAYYCECRIVDSFSDRGWMLGVISAREQRSGRLGRTLIDLNYTHLDRTQQPRTAQFKLVVQLAGAPAGPPQWPAYRWTGQHTKMALLPVPG